MISAGIIMLGGCAFLSKPKTFSNVSKNELDQYAEKIVDRISEFPNDAFSNQLGVDFLFEQMHSAGFEKSSNDYSLKRGLREGLSNFNSTMGQEIANGSYELLRANVKGGEGHLLFRLNSSNGMNYHDMLIVKENGVVKIGDIYIYASGENLSKTLVRTLASMRDENDEYSTEKLEHVKLIGQAQQQMQKGNYKVANEYLEESKSTMGNEKSWHVINITCKSMIDSLQYMTAMRDFGSKFSKDPSWWLMGVDYYFLLGQYDKAENLLKKLNTKVGGDPLITLLRGNVYFMKGDFEKSLDFINNGLAKMPFEEDFYYTKISCEGNLKKYADLKSTLDTVYVKFGIELDDIDYSGFEGFMETDHFKNLMESQNFEFSE